MEEILKNKYRFILPKLDTFYRFENKEFHYRISIERQWLRKLEIIDVRPIPRHFKFIEDFYFKDEKELTEYLDDEYLGENFILNKCERK